MRGPAALATRPWDSTSLQSPSFPGGHPQTVSAARHVPLFMFCVQQGSVSECCDHLLPSQGHKARHTLFCVVCLLLRHSFHVKNLACFAPVLRWFFRSLLCCFVFLYHAAPYCTLLHHRLSVTPPHCEPAPPLRTWLASLHLVASVCAPQWTRKLADQVCLHGACLHDSL